MSPDTSSKRNTAAVLVQIHQVNLNEIELGNIAREKATSDGVRAYADQLVRDHTDLDQELLSMAKTSGNRDALQRLSRQTAGTKNLNKRLGSANGSDFDTLFLHQTSSDHERLIRLLRLDRQDASDDGLEALIDKILPILEQDRELAQILMKKEPA